MDFVIPQVNLVLKCEDHSKKLNNTISGRFDIVSDKFGTVTAINSFLTKCV